MTINKTTIVKIITIIIAILQVVANNFDNAKD